jgi:hypothetical protein
VLHADAKTGDGVFVLREPVGCRKRLAADLFRIDLFPPGEDMHAGCVAQHHRRIGVNADITTIGQAQYRLCIVVLRIICIQTDTDPFMRRVPCLDTAAIPAAIGQVVFGHQRIFCRNDPGNRVITRGITFRVRSLDGNIEVVPHLHTDLSPAGILRGPVDLLVGAILAGIFSTGTQPDTLVVAVVTTQVDVVIGKTVRQIAARLCHEGISLYPIEERARRLVVAVVVTIGRIQMQLVIDCRIHFQVRCHGIYPCICGLSRQ